jgi:NurA-like 5'-3' nuclease
MLLENFDSNYLNSMASKIQEYSGGYTALYEKCAEKIEKDSKASLKGYALKGLSKLSSGAGKIVEKIPVISKSQLDENLLKAGGILQDVDTNRTQNVVKILADSQTDYISSFVENIHTIDSLYNQSMQLMFDSENIYIAKVATA